MKELRLKIQEALVSALPVTVIVYLMALTPLFDFSTTELITFTIGAAALVLGIGLFNMGADLAMTPMGTHIGSGLSRQRKLGLLLSVCFVLGLLITMAEPDLQVLAGQVSAVMNGTLLVYTVGVGVGAFLVVAVLRIVFRKTLGSNLNVGALQYLYLGFERKKRFLCVLPPFIAFGLTVTIHMPLSFGLQTALCIAADPTEIGSFVEQYKPNYIICGTAQAEKMMIALDTKRTDLSNLELLGVGGDALPIALERRMNEFLTSRKSKTRIIQGYAMSETSASSTAAVYTIHKQGTVGIPFVYTTIKVVGVDTMDELSYGQNGEICINTPCAMMGYYQNEKETNSILKRHSDGSLWVHTGDIGNIDQDGFVTIVGRIKRMILTQEGNVFHKVFPKILEDKFLEVKGVEAISIVAKQSKETTNDLVAFVVLDMITPEEEALVALDQFATENLERYERPKKYIFLNRLPLTTVGKVNYRMLEQEAEKTKC